MIFKIIGILNNLSRHNLKTIRFFIEKFHMDMIIWLTLNLLDEKNMPLLTA